MSCRSVACIWSSAPPSHRVTAAVVLNQPLTLYTGGSDGSIIWWNISPGSNTEIRPIAMYCGHAASIADLSICHPLVDLGNEKRDPSVDVEVNSTLENSAALLSVCTDGTLCVWSRSSGHCRCRRKLPPWVGIPSMTRTMPSNPRYVCVGCCFIDSGHLADYNSVDSSESSEVAAEKEPQDRKRSKCSVVILDTYSLTIVQTVFHGILSVGSLKFMDVVSSIDGNGKHSAILVDSLGRLQVVAISKEHNQDRNSGEVLHPSVDALSERGEVVSVTTKGNLVAFVFYNFVLLKLLSIGVTIGKFSTIDDFLRQGHNSLASHAKGGQFLRRGDNGDMMKLVPCENFEEEFIVWNYEGFAIVYRMSYLSNEFKYEPLCEIPASHYSSDVKSSVSFIQLSHYAVRIESLCSQVEEPLHWVPNITIWSLHENHNEETYRKCRMLGEGSYMAEWIPVSTSLQETKGQTGGEGNFNSPAFSFPVSESVNNVHIDSERSGFFQKELLVSSSMVISDQLFMPYAVVYGFFSGAIQVVKFNMCQGLSLLNGSLHSRANKLYFSGHSGPILCLAAHEMMGSAKECSFRHVLISGSADCTVGIWDLDSGNLITVMHQHVAPVGQIILPPPQTDCPWSDCFLSVGEDSCVALTSLETLRVERMFPGHPNYPAKVVWDGRRGYIACLCKSNSGISDALDALYIWDVKTGSRERVLRGTASHSMFDHFCRGISVSAFTGTVLNGNTSTSSLLLASIDDGDLFGSHRINSSESISTSNITLSSTSLVQTNAPQANGGAGTSKHFSTSSSATQNRKNPIKCSSPFPGVVTLSFDLASLLSFGVKYQSFSSGDHNQQNTKIGGQENDPSSPRLLNFDDSFVTLATSAGSVGELHQIRSLEECLIQFSLSLLHLWNLDRDLDNLLMRDMKLKRPDDFLVATGFLGDKGSLTVTFPSLSAILELWKSSSEFCALRSLMMVSLAQHMISLSNSGSAASSALAAFYTRNFVQKIPDIKPPLLQLLVSFWQHESEPLRMAARSLFHCAASRAIPLPLSGQKFTDHGDQSCSTETSRNGLGHPKVNGTPGDNLFSGRFSEEQISLVEESNIHKWLESFEMQDWISCVGGRSQDAMTSHIIVAAALAIWYPSLVKSRLSMLVAHPLVKLVMSMNEKYSSTAAELLAEGMESTWKVCLGSDIPRLIEDIFFQIECVSGSSASSAQNAPLPVAIREILIGLLLPSLAMADIPGFLTVIERQIWSTASDSPVHLVSLMTLIRVLRNSPKNLAQYLDKVVNFILQTMDPSNSVMRKTCFQSSITALKEVARAFPMVALNDTWTRLALADAVGEINNASIHVYDVQSVTKVKILDASGPPGLPSLLAAGSEANVTTLISALSFSPDGEGLVAFSEQGLMIRWWSLESVWWEKLSRNFVPVQCTKLIFVPPWEGFSPNSTRSSIMATIMADKKQTTLQEKGQGSPSHVDKVKLLVHNLDLSYRLEWVGERKVLLTRHGNELGTFQL